MHRSGLRVDDELRNEFLAAQKSPNLSFLQIKIIDDAFKKTGSGLATGEAKSDFDAIQKILKDADPCYVVTRAGVSEGKWLMIFYVPETSIVRLKMLYASSASGLKDGLGSALFTSDFFISTQAECTLAGFQQSQQVLKREDVMTLDEIMKMEEHQATAQLRGASKSSAIADLPLALADDASEAIRAIKESSTQSGIFFF